MFNRWKTTLAIIVLAGLTSWYLNRLDENEPVETVAEKHEPDSFMVNFTQVTMDETGAIQTRLRADTMYHYPDDKTTELINPILQYYSDDGEPWHITAKKGWLDSGYKNIELTGDVNLWRNNPQGERRYEMITSNLHIAREEEFAETDEPVTLIGPSIVTEGIGMRANLKLNRLELLNQVRTNYEPERPE